MFSHDHTYSLLSFLLQSAGTVLALQLRFPVSLLLYLFNLLWAYIFPATSPRKSSPSNTIDSTNVVGLDAEVSRWGRFVSSVDVLQLHACRLYRPACNHSTVLFAQPRPHLFVLALCRCSVALLPSWSSPLPIFLAVHLSHANTVFLSFLT